MPPFHLKIRKREVIPAGGGWALAAVMTQPARQILRLNVGVSVFGVLRLGRRFVRDSGEFPGFAYRGMASSHGTARHHGTLHEKRGYEKGLNYMLYRI